MPAMAGRKPSESAGGGRALDAGGWRACRRRARPDPHPHYRRQEPRQGPRAVPLPSRRRSGKRPPDGAQRELRVTNSPEATTSAYPPSAVQPDRISRSRRTRRRKEPKMPNILLDPDRKQQFFVAFTSWVKSKRPDGTLVYTYAMPVEGPPVGHRLAFLGVPENFLQIMKEKKIPFEIF
jgi:hypothetical protein